MPRGICQGFVNKIAQESPLHLIIDKAPPVPGGGSGARIPASLQEAGSRGGRGEVLGALLQDGQGQKVLIIKLHPEDF